MWIVASRCEARAGLNSRTLATAALTALVMLTRARSDWDPGFRSRPPRPMAAESSSAKKSLSSWSLLARSESDQATASSSSSSKSRRRWRYAALARSSSAGPAPARSFGCRSSSPGGVGAAPLGTTPWATVVQDMELAARMTQ